ncbi:MAG TPA: tail fiber domain-containing protein, partial [Roseiarcus sp.]|nr:tail fiber domain-containing protein [Roseiarcus sp.]
LLGHLDDGLGFYRFTYNGGRQSYVGVIAQEVESVAPDAVARGRDGYLRVDYAKLNLTFQTYAEWIAAGARVPTGEPNASADPARLQQP